MTNLPLLIACFLLITRFSILRRRPAACPLDPENCRVLPGSRGQAAGRRTLKLFNTLKKLRMALLILSLSMATQVSASSYDAESQQFIEALRNFNPAKIIPNYTDHPNAANITTAEDNDPLQALGREQIAQDETAAEILKQAQQRSPLNVNPNSMDMLYAEKLIDSADDVLAEGCYKEPAQCKTEWLEKTCEDHANFQHLYCGKNLTIDLKTKTDLLSRLIYSQGADVVQSFSLTQGSIATKILPGCYHLQASAIAYAGGQYHVEILKQPTCLNPTIEVRGIPQGQLILAITVNQITSADLWSTKECSQEQIKDCFLAEIEICEDSNATKECNGFAFTRPCWGIKSHYACLLERKNNCATLINAGCNQIASLCTKTSFNTCEQYLQTFSCPNQICLPEKTVCPGKIPCADGSCDQSVTETSNDFAEGLTRLGTLAATAEEVAKNQVKNNEPKIFAGIIQECEKYPLGLRDCCTDRGILDGLINCPAELQGLQQAKRDNRAVFIGDYKNHRFGKRRFVYCVFPSKLAGIIQIQGRHQQLGINFGTAKNPNCTGITPEILERIDFAALNLNDLVAEFKNRAKYPQDGSIAANASQHIAALTSKGKPYD